MELLDRYQGAFLGLATGDALGTTLEFRSPGSFTPIDDLIGGGPFKLPAGYWTDDTSMALCMAASLIDSGQFDPFDQMTNYVSWFKEGYMSSTGRCFDIGFTTRRALTDFANTGNPMAGSTDPKSAGNGSLMRLVPTPLFFYPNKELMVEKSGVSSKTTHGAPQAVAACRYFAYLIALALDGKDKAAILSDHSKAPELQEEMDSTILEIMKGSFRDESGASIRGTGYVVKSLEAALWAFCYTDNFRDGALKVVNLGDDADTTGAIYGQLAGAYYGVSGIPQAWLKKLKMRLDMEVMAESLLRLASQQNLNAETK